MVRRYLFSILSFLFLFSSLHAQPTLLFKRIEVNYPEIRLAFKTTCGGIFRNDLGPEHYSVYENGLHVKDATLWCPPENECCVSVAMVFDRSGSMKGEKMTKVIAGGVAYVNSMNPDGLPCDEAAVVSFANDVTLDIPMTTSKPQLVSAINQFKGDGRTALWDGVAVGIQELINSAANRCKAVVVLTDGGDNNSQFFLTVNSVIAFAQSSDVKVYTVGYGVPQGGLPELNLQLLASATGGKYYYSEEGSDLEQIYASIKESVKEDFKECYITYQSGCPDGSQRVVELQIKDFCGGSAASTRTYVAPLNTSAFERVGLRIGSGTVRSTEEIVVPILLETPVDAVLSRAEFAVSYDRNLVEIVGMDTDGTMLEGVPVSMRSIGSGYIFYIEEHSVISGSGVLMNLRFRAADVTNPVSTVVFMHAWTFEAYCLIPMLRSGRLEIVPREPEINCEIIAPDVLQWDDVNKRYEPNPFNVTVRVTNSGSREARSVRATLVTNLSVVKLIEPQSIHQNLSPDWINPGSVGEATWKLEAIDQENLDSISIYISVEADNHETIACWKRIVVAEALSPALVCSVTAPDTVFFMEQYYEPEEFDIHVQARNVGSGQTGDVRAQLLQDTRFTIISPASLQLADVLLSGEAAGGTFRVKMHPRDTDGYDTIRVNVQGEESNPAWCYYPVWVQRVRSPEFSLLCTTPQDSLVFSEQDYDYKPNPFEVTTFAENIGETYAEECQIMFAGPPRFTPVGTNLRPEGTMFVGDTRSETWMIRALPRSTGGWDTLHFQIIGRGGLGRQIVIGECLLPVYVPAIRKPYYELSCSSPDSLVYRDNNYDPDPVVFTTSITNTGTASGFALTPTIIPPPSVTLADGETAIRYIPEIRVGETIAVSWKLKPAQRSNDGSYRFCARVVDSIGISEECCTDIFIPRTENPVLMPSCWSVDTLFINPDDGEYLGNPFEVVLNLTNVGVGAAEQAVARIDVLGSFMQIVGAQTKQLGNIAPGASVRVTWMLRALRRSKPSDIPIILTAGADNHAPRECALSVHVMATLEPELQAECWSIPEDSLFFDWDVGDFEYSECTLKLRVTNSGEVNAKNVTALLVVPSGVVLQQGEETLKPVDPAELGPGQSGTAEWKFRALRSDDDVMREFSYLVRSDNAAETGCSDDLFVEGSPKEVTLTMPQHVLFRYGQKGVLPVLIDRTIGKDLSEYSFAFHYDAEVISVLSASNTGTLTGIGWVGTTLSEVRPGLVLISDYTTGTPLATDAGVLVNFYVEGIYNNNPDVASFGESELHIDESGALFNRGEIAVATIDGSTIVTNQCLEPLIATERFTLEQNRPNPFNPETVISFRLPADSWVRLSVYDTRGREVTVLLDEQLKQGNHSAVFHAEGLPSGMYFYMIETSTHFDVKKMILAR